MDIDGAGFWCIDRTGSILESAARLAFSVARRTLERAASTIALLVLGTSGVEIAGAALATAGEVRKVRADESALRPRVSTWISWRLSC
jgi:hypothetical protein